MKCLIVFNPYSGQNKFQKEIPYLTKKLEELNYTCDIFSPSFRGEIGEKIINTGSQYDLLYVSGGDGTLHEVLNALMKIPFVNRPKIYFYPSGTLNDFATSFSLKVSINKSIEIIKENNLQKFDVIKSNDKYFIYAGAFGKFTSCSYNTYSHAKRILKRFYYYLLIFKDIFKRYKQNITLICEDKHFEYKNYVTFFLNTRRIGGFKIKKNSGLYFNDHIFDLVLIKKTVFNFLRLILFFFFNYSFKVKSIIYLKTNNVTIKSNSPIYFNGDGELLLKDQTIHLTTNEHDFINIYLPKKVNKYFK